MSNGAECCALGICCPPLSQEQVDALAEEMVHGGTCDMETAKPIAAWLLKEYDLAPAGSLTELKRHIAKLVRKADKKDKD